jgi:hypothetical protein
MHDLVSSFYKALVTMFVCAGIEPSFVLQTVVIGLLRTLRGGGAEQLIA